MSSSLSPSSSRHHACSSSAPSGHLVVIGPITNCVFEFWISSPSYRGKGTQMATPLTRHPTPGFAADRPCEARAARGRAAGASSRNVAGPSRRRLRLGVAPPTGLVSSRVCFFLILPPWSRASLPGHPEPTSDPPMYPFLFGPPALRDRFLRELFDAAHFARRCPGPLSLAPPRPLGGMARENAQIGSKRTPLALSRR